MSGDRKIAKVAISVTNCICYDQRVLKIAETIYGLGTDLTIIGRITGGCQDDIIPPFRIVRFRMFFRRKFLFYGFYNIRLFLHLLTHRYDLLVANDLDTLLPNYIVSRLRKIPLVYDSHEYFTGVPEIQNRPFVKWVWKTIERSIFPGLKFVMTVSDSISEQYRNEYGVRPIVIRNCSRSSGHISPFTRAELGIPEGKLLLIYQGAGINVDRGGEELIGAIQKTENVFLLIVGSGDVLEDLKKMVSESSLSDRVKFIPKVGWDELLRYTKSADAGISVDKSNNPNYRFSLPNKLFDYISAGIPVIASDLQEIRKLVTEYKTGILIPKVDQEEISEAIIRLRDNPDILSELKRNSVVASGVINWDLEKVKLTDFYSGVLKSNVHVASL